MKNITLAVDEDVLVAVRRAAAERNSTVNAIVREYLESIARHQNKASEARKRLQELGRKSTGDLGEKGWNRQDLYER